MNYEVATLYDQWDLKLPLFPPRSYLYHLQPIGIGTANVESLTGYITRLAQAHCIEPGILMERVVAPVGIKIPGSTKSSRTGVFGHTATFNGTGMMAAQWVQALESLTLRSDLRFLTMLTWTNVIPPRGLLRHGLAYCPICYEQWRETGQAIYEPLLWSLNVVKICPHHHQLLLTECPHCQVPLSPLAWRSRSGYCSRCGGWLGFCLQPFALLSDTLTKTELNWQTWVVKTVGEMVAAASQLILTPSREMIGRSLSAYVNLVAFGNVAMLARLLQMPKHAVWQWCTGKVLPQFDTLLQVCYCLGTSVLDFLTGVVTTAVVDGITAPLPPKTRCANTAFCRTIPIEKLRRQLEAFLEDNRSLPLPMTQVAKSLGYDVRILRRHFADLCHAISQRYLDYRKAQHNQKLEISCEEVRQVAFRLFSQGIEPTRSEVARFLSKPAYFREREVCNALLQVRYRLGLEM